MKVIGKILMIFATAIIIAHTIIPHQHKAQLEIVIHECLFSDWEGGGPSSNIFEKLGDAIKHVNLGEKHLENFRVSSYEYEFSPVTIFEIPEILSLLKFQIQHQEKASYTFYYTSAYTSVENRLSCGLRAPPYCI